MKTHFFILFIFSFGASVIFLGCGPGGECPIIVEIEEELANYHKESNQLEQRKSEGDIKTDFNVYIDYSGGMYPAISQCYEFLNAVITIVDDDATNFFHVGEGEVRPLEGDILDLSHPSNPRNEENYDDPRSFLDLPIQEIVKNKKEQSIFITDFELFKGENVETEAWATNEFEEWLKSGNRIDIFAKQFDKNNGARQQYLYFILFTPRALAKESGALLNRLIKDGYGDGKMDIEYLSFSLEAYRLQPKYASDNQGGLNQELGADEYYNYSGKQFEYYNFAASDAKDVLVDLSENEQYLIKGLKYLKNDNSFGNPKFRVEIHDITMNFQDFQMEENPPSPIEKEKNIFNVSIDDNKDDIEFLINFSDDFQGMSSNCALYRVQIHLEDADLSLNNSKMSRILQWDDGVRTVRALNESLKEAMGRLEIKQQLLYTYYIDLGL